jgi:hypothetical protein
MAVEGDEKSSDMFNMFQKQLESQQFNLNPNMNMMNFYKILFSEISSINLDMNSVMQSYREQSESLQPSEM